MSKNIIILPDGTEISSGVGQTNNIRSTALTECVNSGEELALGSVCANMLEITIQTPSGNLSLTAGTEITLCKEDADGRHQVGQFTLEKPTRPSANLMKLTGYDRVAKLDKDLTAWLKGLDGWPYDLLTFAGMVCEACGLTLATESIPNGDYPVQKLEIEATGRQLMGWIGEVCCRFCRANASGDIELAWYKQANISFAPSGEHFYFQRGLSFEDYQVAPIEAVQLRLADSDDGALWPVAEDGANCYVIKNNPILMAAVTDATRTALQVIEGELEGVSYTPCKVSIPATLDIHAGDIVQITDVNGVTITTYVMTKVQKGRRDTLECTGSPRRDSSTAVNNGGPDYISAAQAGAIASQKAAAEAEKLDQLELLKRLTKDWVDDGIYLTKDGKLAINASAILSGIIQASLVQAGVLRSKDDKTFFLDLDNGILRMQATEFSISGKTVDQIASEKVNDYADVVTKNFEELQAQIDGNITSWFGDVVPTTSNEPAVNWTTEELKNQHLGDLYYVNEGVEQGGTAYRWAVVNGTYKWVIVEDTDVAKALAAAAKAQDTADGKRRVFVVQPTPPYDVGDLWAQGSAGDLMRCKTARAEGASYVASDWELASKYIDSETAGNIAQEKVDGQTQKEIFDKLTDNGTIEGLYMQDGKLYVNASYIKSGVLDAALITVKNLSADRIVVNNENGETLFRAGDGAVQLSSWDVAPHKLTNGTIDTDGYVGIYSSFKSGDGDYDEYGDYVGPGNGSAAIQGGHYSDSWRLLIGRYFGVDKFGSLYCSSANISGTVYASGGNVGCWNINDAGLWTGSADGSEVGVSLGKGYLFTSLGSGWTQIMWRDIHNCAYEWKYGSSSESDRDVKHSISNIDNYDAMFDGLKPRKYKYNHGTSDRYHTGFIAQEVVEAIESAGLTTQDFAGVMHLEEPNDNGCEWLLRRDEFVALNTWQIQKLKDRVAALEALVAQKS